MEMIKDIYTTNEVMFGLSDDGVVYKYEEGSNGPVWVEIRFEKREEK